MTSRMAVEKTAIMRIIATIIRFLRKTMHYGESTSARPIGAPDGPREDYKPDRHVYRRGEIRSRSLPSKPLYLEGAYTDRIVAAAQSGYRTTTEIVTVTGIPRDIAIKTLSYLIGRQRLRELPIFEGVPEGDRCVGPADAFPSPASNAADPEESAPFSAAQEDSHQKASDDVMLVGLSAFQRIVEEWDAISMDVAAIRTQAVAVQKRLDIMSEALPVLYDAVKAAEKARESQVILASIMKSIHSLEPSS